ncbi:UNVERIFIED_CONTAM: hypothetical protein Scaly_2650200 [Sesamum calycinum]|uniref:Uncharacterized protein n=1 Tax=Sesamum calycinum TaxID=2727403 RepID=A0AAW2J8M7_9LAMI
MEDVPLIQFGKAKCSRPKNSHNDALVIMVLLANYEVGRVFIDSGSSGDILFGEAYSQMKLADIPLENVNTSLYGFAEEVVHHRGMISLPLALGIGQTRRTCMLKFLIKFPALEGVGEVQEDPLQSCKCYIEAVRKGQKRSTDEALKEPPSCKRRKDGEVEEEPEVGRGTPLKVLPAEELLNLELIPRDSEKTT